MSDLHVSNHDNIYPAVFHISSGQEDLTLPAFQSSLSSNTLLSDREIQAIPDLITPFTDHIVREVNGKRVFSYGLGSYGYDIRLAAKSFYQIINPGGDFNYTNLHIDPKRFDSRLSMRELELIVSDDEQYFLMPPHSYCLGVAEEKLTMPKHITGFGFCKSSYTRVGVSTFITPIESGWAGHLTIGIGNMSPAPVRVYANEGLAQIVFAPGNVCATSYDDRAGKYQNQGKEVTFTKV